MSRWAQRLDWDFETTLCVEYEVAGRAVTDYSVVLAVMHEGRMRTVRVYDAAHGVNELHRHTLSSGKQPGAPAHPGTLGEGMRAAIDDIRRGYREMIEGWRR